MTNDTVHFNVYCTTIKQQQSTRYSKTVLYNTFIYQVDLQMEGIYSLADNQQIGEGLYNHLQRN